MSANGVKTQGCLLRVEREERERERDKEDRLFGTIGTNLDCAVNKPGGGCGGERLKGGDKNGDVPMIDMTRVWPL